MFRGTKTTISCDHLRGNILHLVYHANLTIFLKLQVCTQKTLIQKTKNDISQNLYLVKKSCFRCLRTTLPLDIEDHSVTIQAEKRNKNHAQIQENQDIGNTWPRKFKPRRNRFSLRGRRRPVSFELFAWRARGSSKVRGLDSRL